MSDGKKFQAGDVVRLKSGGPKMTVTQCDNDMFGRLCVWVSWFDEKNKSVSDTFAVAAVELDTGR